LLDHIGDLTAIGRNNVTCSLAQS